jgi:hypothetical protein
MSSIALSKLEARSAKLDPRHGPEALPRGAAAATVPAMSDAVASFIARWSRSAGAERANHQPFVIELCDLLGVPRPDPSVKDGDNAYVFEKPVILHDDAGGTSTGRIDCYRRGCFVLEAKQATPLGPGRRGTPAHQSHLLKARKQAEGYVRALDPASEPAVPFLIVLDVGGSFDLYADFTRTNRFWTAFPDAASNRIRLEDLADPARRALLAAIWNDPYALDPATRAQVVTRDAAERLAVIARELETAGHPPERVAGFLMRYFFCAFAEDVGLMRRRQFTEFLAGFRGKAAHLAPALEALWGDLDRGGFSQALRADVLRFNGGLFAESYALPVDEAQLSLLVATAELDWSPVEPAIFGTLLERALDPRERHRLGAHYTPRAYVDRLVSATMTEPLRARWRQVQDAIEGLLADDAAASVRTRALALVAELSGEPAGRGRSKGKDKAESAQLVAQRLIAAFHRHLAGVRVLDPACGSGNFLYVALEHLKRLEGEVLALEARLGAAGSRIAMGGLDIDPRSVLGLELNPRAARIAELVLWIGYLQWYRRSHGGSVAQWPDPVLHAYRNIDCRDAVVEASGGHATGETRWDGRSTRAHPVTGEQVPDERARLPVVAYDAARPAAWPACDYIVGNPPFIGNKRMRAALGDGYVEAVRRAWPAVPETADFVMYWWHHAAELVRTGRVRRFGLITTNSITQTFNRGVVQTQLDAGLTLAWAIPDHPWVDAAEGAAVRVAMTVGAAADERPSGPRSQEGRLLTVATEGDTVGDVPAITYAERRGVINADLTIGADVTRATGLAANAGLCGQGIKVVGDGFYVDSQLDPRPLNPKTGVPVVRVVTNARDVLSGQHGSPIIDFFGLERDEALRIHPTAFQQVMDRVKPLRDTNKRDSIRDLWWRFAWERPVIRAAIKGLGRYMVTLSVSKHRFFVFIPELAVWDGALFAIASNDAFHLGVLSSRVHLVWADAAGGTLEDRPTWTNGTCFDPFPFPACSPAQQAAIRALGEELDAHRKRQQAAHPGLTLTGMYNVLAKLRSGAALTAKEKAIHEQGLCSVLRDLHDRLDAAVAAAYGWPVDLPDDELLARLVALNAARAAEEAAGTVRWLRPDYQIPLLGARAAAPRRPRKAGPPSA